MHRSFIDRVAQHLARPVRGLPKHPRKRRRRRFLLEKLEDRHLMDGTGFVHTDPDPDPGSVVGVAGVEAHDDYVSIGTTTGQVRIDVLANDPLPDGGGGLKIKSVSETARGASVTISDDGRRIIYTPPEGGVSYDSFYYIIETDDGKLGKANVTISGVENSPPPPYEPSRNDAYQLYEDDTEATLNVLRNDGPFSDGEIVAVTSASLGTVRIADDGKTLLYQPNPATTGHDSFEYTVRRDDGETAVYSVRVDIVKPYQIKNDGDGSSSVFARDVDTGPHTFNLLANDRTLAPTPEQPRIVDIDYPQYAGELQISEDGQSATFAPAADFLGTFSYSYTVRYGLLEYQTIEGAGSIRVQNTFLAVDNWFAVDVDSPGATLDVLANDPALRRYSGNWQALPDVALTIVQATAGSQGGQVTIAADGKTLQYAPAAGFTGDDTFTYTVEDSNGHRDSATVTVHVAEPVSDSGLPKFFLPGQLRQFLIDQAVEKFKDDFGVTARRYVGSPGDESVFLTFYAADATVANDGVSHSDTNTQEAGVDEADIIETDGRYLYTFSDGKLVIADLGNLRRPRLVSFTGLDGHFSEMYLQGDRLTLLDRGTTENGKTTAVVMVLDVSDRRDPSVVERTEIDGRIVDSRAVGDRVYVAVSGLEVPEIDYRVLAGAATEEGFEVRVNETLDEYVARVRDSIIESSLPAYRTYDSAGELIDSGSLTDPANIHQPIDHADNALLSLVTFDAGDDVAGPLSSTGIFTSPASEIYMSGDSIYALRNHGGDTAVFKFHVVDDGTTELAATGTVAGQLLNQFSVDEHGGRLRIATTQTVNETVDGRVRQQRRFNNLFVLEQHGTQLVVVGGIENLAPTETIKSVRFLDDRAYVVTFRVIDPLFVVDLSDPMQPTVEGSLKIPGFSDYLHPVGEDYVIGIGHEANEITGRVGPPQISLFYVGDLASPTLVDQVTMEGAQWASTEASLDHHAVAYFAEHQVLTIPVDWTESTDVDDNGDGLADYRSYDQLSAIWTFQIDVDGAGGGSIDVTGSVEHEGSARRSVRIGEALVTVSENTIKINELDDPATQVSQLYMGRLPVDDTFTVQEDSGANVLDVRANDHPGARGRPPQIVAVSQPLQPGLIWYGTRDVSIKGAGAADSAPVGVVEITNNGRSLVFTPNENFFGTATFTYTVFDEVRGEQHATVTIHVENVPDAPEAVDDQFQVDPNSTAVVLDVLANDLDRDGYGNSPAPISLRPVGDFTLTNLTIPVIDLAASSSFMMTNVGTIETFLLGGLSISEVGLASHGGTVEIDAGGQHLIYSPAEGFLGVETFSYTITAPNGLTAVATVSVHVGDEVFPAFEPKTDDTQEQSDHSAPPPTEESDQSPATDQAPPSAAVQEPPPAAAVQQAEPPSLSVYAPDTDLPASPTPQEVVREDEKAESPVEQAAVPKDPVPDAEPEEEVSEVQVEAEDVALADVEEAARPAAIVTPTAVSPVRPANVFAQVEPTRQEHRPQRRHNARLHRTIETIVENHYGDLLRQRWEQLSWPAEKQPGDRDSHLVDLAFGDAGREVGTRVQEQMADWLAAVVVNLRR